METVLVMKPTLTSSVLFSCFPVDFVNFNVCEYPVLPTST